MKILKPTAYYFPEKYSNEHLTEGLEKAIIENGYEMKILTPSPTRGVSKETRSKYKKINKEFKYDNKIEIQRFKMFREPKNVLVRFLRYWLCCKKQYRLGKKCKDCDVISISSTPPFLAFYALKLKKKLNIPLIFKVADVFPDSLVNSGLTKENSFIYKYFAKKMNKVYEGADRINVVSEDIKKNLLNKGVKAEKITVIHDCIDTKECTYVEKNNNILFEQFKLDRNKFYVLYSGNLGYSQNVNIITEIAKHFTNNSEIQFLIVGDGICKDNIIKEIENNQLTNIQIFPLQGKNLISSVYSLGDICLVTGKPGIGKAGMPSKTWSILSCGRPVLANFDKDTELQRIIEENNLGIFTEVNNVQKIVEGINYLYKVDRDVISSNCRRFAIENVDKDIVYDLYVKTYDEVLHG